MTEAQASAVRQVIAEMREHARHMSQSPVLVLQGYADAVGAYADRLEAVLGEAPASWICPCGAINQRGWLTCGRCGQGKGEAPASPVREGFAAGLVMVCPHDGDPCIAACHLEDPTKHPQLTEGEAPATAGAPSGRGPLGD